MRTPQPSTKRREGFQSLLIHKKERIFLLLVIPATKRPMPKRKPTRKLIPLSLAIVPVSFEGDIFFFSTTAIINGRRIPMIKQIFADAKC